MNNNGDVMVLLGVYAVIIGSFLAVSLAINALICWLVSGCYKRIPQQFRKMEPGMVWLLMIPCVPIVWNFFVFPRLAESYKAYFDSVGNTEVGDCGAQISLFFAVAVVCAHVPCLNYFAGPVALVLLIITLVKAHDLKNKIPETAAVS